MPKRWIVERTIAWLNRVEGSPKTGRTSIARRSHSFASHQSASCSENFAIQPDVSGQTLNTEIHDRADDAARGAHPAENVFAELVLEYLSDAGIIENASVASFEGRVGRGIGKVSGYAVGEDEDLLDLFITIFLDATEPTKLPPDQVRKAIEQAVRFGHAALKGLHKDMSSASEADPMTSRINELRDKIDRVRIFVLTDGITPDWPARRSRIETMLEPAGDLMCGIVSDYLGCFSPADLTPTWTLT